MNRWFVRRILYPIHERLRGRETLALLRQFRRTETLSADNERIRRDRAVARLVRHAADQVPHFRSWFAENDIDPRSITGRDDLRRLPTMDKGFIRANRERLVAESWRDRVFELATGGSSGEPLIFYTDKTRESSQLAAKLRAREWWGIAVGDRQADLWGSPIELSRMDRFRTLKDRILNLIVLPAFELSDETMATFREALSRFKADFLYGYASVLARYARFLETRGESLVELRLKGAVCTAELLFPDQRDVIERVFGCAAINEYGCRDGGYIAQECPEGRLHIASDTVHVEILDEESVPAAPGVVGEVTITNLWSFGMPLIRYRLGDRAALTDEACPCGRVLPVLSDLEGRVTDTLYTPDGKRVHGLGMMYILRDDPDVERYQVIQDALDHVEILVVPRAAGTRDSLQESVRTRARKVLSETMRIDVRLVEDIPPLPSGKMRAIWNRLDEQAPTAG